MEVGEPGIQKRLLPKESGETKRGERSLVPQESSTNFGCRIIMKHVDLDSGDAVRRCPRDTIDMGVLLQGLLQASALCTSRTHRLLTCRPPILLSVASAPSSSPADLQRSLECGFGLLILNRRIIASPNSTPRILPPKKCSSSASACPCPYTAAI